MYDNTKWVLENVNHQPEAYSLWPSKELGLEAARVLLEQAYIEDKPHLTMWDSWLDELERKGVALDPNGHQWRLVETDMPGEINHNGSTFYITGKTGRSENRRIVWEYECLEGGHRVWMDYGGCVVDE